MNVKKLLVSTAFLASVISLAACGNPSSSEPAPTPGSSASTPASPVEKVGTIQVAVGTESVNFYKEILKAKFTDDNTFAYNVEVVASDAGTIADSVIKDGDAAPDIFTVAHDNIGKLTEANAVAPIINKDLLTQIEQDNPDAFKSVIKVDSYTYAVPYISQALVLMYNKTLVKDEQAKSFEGLLEAAKAAGKKAVAFSGTDGYNFSAFALARKVSDKSTTVKIFENADQSACYFQGEDTYNITKWAQGYFADKNGAMFPTNAGWTNNVQSKDVLAFVSGAWHISDFQTAVGGAANTGITILPTFKANNVEYRAGSFVDCKVLMMNAFKLEGEKQKAAQQIIKYMSSKEVQNESFKKAQNMPAYKGATEYIESIKSELGSTDYQGAMAQSAMSDWGIAQPFVTTTLNQFYYSKGTADIYKNIVLNTESAYTSEKAIREALYTIEYTWQKGQAPAPADIPATLPSDVK